MRFKPVRVKSFLVLLLVFGGVDCTGDPAQRFDAQFGLGFAVIREGLEIHLEPGCQPRVDELEQRVWLHASAPTATIVIDHGGADWTQLDLELDNVFVRGRFIPVFSHLGRADFPTCPDLPSSEEILLAPLIPSQERTPERVFSGLHLPPCSRTVIRALPPGTLGQEFLEPVRIAVVGEIKGNDEIMNTLIEHIGSPPTVDLVVALGNLANSPDWLDLEEWRESMASMGVPVVTAIGADEIVGGAQIPFHDVFGRTDFAFEIGDVQCFVMDTASAGLSSQQYEYWEEALRQADGSIRLVFMQIPPFDPSGTRDRGFTSRQQASRLISLLGDSDVDAVFTGGIGTYRRLHYGGIPFYSTGGGGGPLEAFDDWGHHFLRVTVKAGADPPLDVELEQL